MNVFISRVAVTTAVVGVAFGLVRLAAGQSAAAAQGTQAAPDTVAPAAGKQAAGGRVAEKGPGYSIVWAAPGARSQAAQTKVTDAPLETLREPIVCQGDRVLSIDNRNIRFEGNAVTAEDGCELHIINSRISASGVAIRARNASVHIENSEIEGGKAAIDAAGAAQIYAETSTFRGAAVRLGEAGIHDLGNNVWD